MSPEEKALLVRTAKLVEENNTLLRKIRRSNRISTVMQILYWIVIIGLSLGAYYVVQPYVTFLTGLIKQSGSTYDSQSFQNAVSSIREFVQQSPSQ